MDDKLNETKINKLETELESLKIAGRAKKKMPFRYICNTSHKTLILSRIGPEGLSLTDGAKIDLFEMFTEKEIEAAKSELVLALRGKLITTFDTPKAMSDFAIKPTKGIISMNDEGVVTSNSKQRVMTAPANEYDDRIVDEHTKEKKSWEKAKKIAGSGGADRVTRG